MDYAIHVSVQRGNLIITLSQIWKLWRGMGGGIYSCTDYRTNWQQHQTEPTNFMPRQIEQKKEEKKNGRTRKKMLTESVLCQKCTSTFVIKHRLWWWHISRVHNYWLVSYFYIYLNEMTPRSEIL